jgi:hypothetical protein
MKIAWLIGLGEVSTISTEERKEYGNDRPFPKLKILFGPSLLTKETKIELKKKAYWLLLTNIERPSTQG